MSILQSVKRIVLERQGGRCAMGAACKLATEDGRGVDLELFKAAKALHKYLPNGRTAVEFDHIVPRAGGGADDPDNVQALCGWCHHDKTENERPDWEAPSPSVVTHLVKTRGSKGINGPGTFKNPARGRAAKVRSLQNKRAVKAYG